MESEILDAIREWSPHPVADGYAGLHDLADERFSGAVTAGDAWAFLLNGRVVGVFDGTIEAFEAADLDAYVAPDEALPLLYTMRLGDGQTRAKYYTNETPLSEVDETLSDGGFTGYVELSENVLSGDYYVVYSGGKSMSVAFVGNSRRLVTGDEAFERANDEVGIYEVKEATIDVVDVPEPPEPEPEEPSTDVEAVTIAGDETADADEGSADETSADETGADDEASADETSAEAADDPAESGDGETAGSDDTAASPSGAASTGDAEADANQADAASTTRTGDDAVDAGTPSAGENADAGVAPDSTEDIELTAAEEAEADAAEHSASATDAESATDAASTTGGDDATQQERTDPSRAAEVPASTADASAAAEQSSEPVGQRTQRTRPRADAPVAGRRSDADPERTLSPEEALAGTNLFVRYETKSAGTLQGVHEGQTTRETVDENLVLDYHANVDTDGLYVDGAPYEEFLRGTVHYEFVRWLVTDLFYEIRDTGSRRVLDRLYDAVPDVDRIDFSTAVEGAGEEYTFDVVCYDKMGNPCSSRTSTTRGSRRLAG
ncbi:hypothetical protein ACFQJD_05245 [Haloplanus sp. GCM10025708]|uniref:DUF7527 domain-containing protein n=1 Tax=Haloplanus sp. GCM10025708 TaxID=3252679 RepID=UPI00361114E0